MQTLSRPPAFRSPEAHAPRKKGAKLPPPSMLPRDRIPALEQPSSRFLFDKNRVPRFHGIVVRPQRTRDPASLVELMYLILWVTVPDASDILPGEQEKRLRETIASAPGVIKVDDIIHHGKGGLMVSFDHGDRPVSPIVEFVKAAGYSLVC